MLVVLWIHKASPGSDGLGSLSTVSSAPPGSVLGPVLSPICAHCLVLSSSLAKALTLSMHHWPFLPTGNRTAFPWSADSPAFRQDRCTSSFSSNFQHPLSYRPAAMTSLPIALRKQKPPEETSTDSTASPSVCGLLLSFLSSYHGPNLGSTP